jgi:hypothetical protein
MGTKSIKEKLATGVCMALISAGGLITMGTQVNAAPNIEKPSFVVQGCKVSKKGRVTCTSKLPGPRVWNNGKSRGYYWPSR